MTVGRGDAVARVLCAGVLAVAGWHAPAGAAMNKCVDAGGRVTFSDQPCPPATAAPGGTPPSAAPPPVRAPANGDAPLIRAAERAASEAAEAVRRQQAQQNTPVPARAPVPPPDRKQIEAELAAAELNPAVLALEASEIVLGLRIFDALTPACKTMYQTLEDKYGETRREPGNAIPADLSQAERTAFRDQCGALVEGALASYGAGNGALIERCAQWLRQYRTRVQAGTAQRPSRRAFTDSARPACGRT